MNARPDPDEAALQAFIDDRLTGEAQEAVAAQLAADPSLSASVSADRAHREALRRALADVGEETVPARLRIETLRARQKALRLSRWRAMAAGLALLTVGAAGGWVAGRLPVASRPAAVITVAEQAGAAYRTYVVEIAHPVEVDTSREAHLLQWLSKRLGRPLAAPDLGRFGYELMGGRLLPGADGAAAQLMYQDASGQRLTLYVGASRGEETAFRFLKDGRAATFAWIDQGFGFAVTAPVDRETLLPIAETIYHRFEAVGPGPARGAAL